MIAVRFVVVLAILASEPGLRAQEPCEPRTTWLESTTPNPAKFGDPGSSRFVAVPIVGYTRAGREFMAAGNMEVDYFFLRNVSVNLGLQGYYFDQIGPNALGAGPSATIRWHFLSNDAGTLFVAAGIGLMGTTERVPAEGSFWNLTPRVALGFTKEIYEHTRLIGGVRVNHIVGLDDLDGPSRTAVQLFLGLSVPF